MVQASQSGTSATLVRKDRLKFLVLHVTLDRRLSETAFRYLQDYRLCHLCRLYVPCVMSQDRYIPRKVLRRKSLRKTRRQATIFFSRPCFDRAKLGSSKATAHSPGPEPQNQAAVRQVLLRQLCRCCLPRLAAFCTWLSPIEDGPRMGATAKHSVTAERLAPFSGTLL
jgi:hypothetical protein